MTARALIDGATLGPEALSAVSQAFDEAWLEIEGNFGPDPTTQEVARNKLAIAMLSIATDDSRDVDVLKRAALEVMATDYVSRTGFLARSRLPGNA